MNAIRPWIACGLMTFCSAAAAAQTLEVGATIAASCQGGGTTLCDATQSDLAMAGPFASIWFNDFIEVSGRVAWLERRDFSRGFGIGLRSTYFISERERTTGEAEVVWHFRRERRVRIMFGVGLGRYWDREVISCQPAGCEPGLRAAYFLETGPTRDSQLARSILVGLSATVLPRLRVRGGWRYHNPLAGNDALPEFFVGAGYRFRN